MRGSCHVLRRTGFIRERSGRDASNIERRLHRGLPSRRGAVPCSFGFPARTARIIDEKSHIRLARVGNSWSTCYTLVSI